MQAQFLHVNIRVMLVGCDAGKPLDGLYRIIWGIKFPFLRNQVSAHSQLKTKVCVDVWMFSVCMQERK